MEGLREEVPLPRSVDELIDKICADQSQAHPEAKLRWRLAQRGEEGALEILRTIATTKIKRSLSGFIIHLLERSSSPRSTPPKRLRLSDSPTSGSGVSDKVITVQCYAPPKGATEAVSRCLFLEAPTEGGEAVMAALGELEFRKQFLILNYIGSNELQTVLRAEEIRNLKGLQMVEFERKL